MKIILKILAAPVTLAVGVFIRLCAALISGTAFLFGLAGSLLTILALAVRLLGGLQTLNLSLRNFIFG